MGWLRELLRERPEPGISFSEVARRLRKPPFEWPRQRRPTERSFATYLTEFDKGRKLEWLAQHPQIEALLAQFVDLSVEQLREHMGQAAAPAASAETSLLSLWEVEARPINLREEPLPPAFPAEVLDSSSWPVLWRAPSGSGRSLVGRWLEARALARFVRAESWDEASKQLGALKEPVFLELTSAEGLPLSSKDSGQLCIAVDEAPQQPQPINFAAIVAGEPEPLPFDWKQVSSPAVEVWLEPLVRWVAERVPSTTRLDVDACLEWIRKELLPQRVIDRFETVLGFIGLFASYHHRFPKEPRALSLMKLADLFLRQRRRQMEAEDLPLSHKDFLDQLQQLSRQMLLRGERSWQQAQSRGEWLELLTTRPDAAGLAYFEELSTRYALGVDKGKLRAAMEEQPPGGHFTFQQLQRMQLLREKSPRRYVLQPSWLLTTLLTQAADNLLDEGPEQWGAALLSKHGARFVLARLSTRCSEGDFAPVRRLLSAPSFASAAWVAALECAFRALGLAALYEHEVPRELMEQVLAYQQRLVLERHGEPLPRIGYSDELNYMPLSLGFWFLAAHAMVDKLGLAPGELHPVFTLDPIAGDSEVLGRVLGQVELVSLVRLREGKLALRVLSLYGRFLPRTGPLSQVSEPIHSILLPAFLLQRFRAGALDFRDFAGAYPGRHFVPQLRAYVKHHQESWEDFLQALWKAWLAASVELPWWMGQGDWFEELYSQLPPEGFTERLAALLEDERFPYERLRAEQWGGFLKYWKAQVRRGLERKMLRPWGLMPGELVRRALDEDVIHPHQARVFEEIWRTSAAVVRESLAQFIRRGRWKQALNLIWYAPSDETPGLMELMSVEAYRQDAPRDSIVFWLHGLIRDRAPGWERAWELLHELAAPVPAR